MRTRRICFFIFASNEIREDDYDRWRYYYPKYVTTKLWAKVPSQELSDTLMDTFKSHPTNKGVDTKCLSFQFILI